MGKKRSKKSIASSNFSSTSDADCSFVQNISTGDDHVVFKVLLSNDTENTNEYYKWTKNCYWKNVAFLGPSMLQDCGDLVLIQGKTKHAVVKAKPLKTIKNGKVVLLQSMGFHNDELVTLHNIKEIFEAKEIFFAIESSLSEVFFQEMLKKKLSNRFIWTGLKIPFTLFDVESECIVSKALSTEKIFRSNCLADDPSLHVSSLLSSLTLHDCTNQSVEEQTPSCFITNHRSSFVVNKTLEEEPKLVFPLFEHIGGYHHQIEIIQKLIDTFLKTTKREGCSPILMLSGPSKTGKNMTVNAIFNEYDVPTMKINMTSLICQNTSTILEEIKLVVKSASKSSPSFLLLDKFDLFCSLKAKDHVSNVLRCLSENCGNQILIIVTMNSEYAFDKQLLHSSFSVKEVIFPSPCTLDREDIIVKILSKQNQELPAVQVKHCAELLQGLNGGHISNILNFDAPLFTLIRRKRAQQMTDVSGLNFSDVESAVGRRKSSLMSPDLKAKKVKWADIGGMERIKRELMEELEMLTQTPKEKLQRFNYSPSQGILLYGPPGCSKTMIARALATECNWNFISKKASDIMNMYVGESEKAVTNLFLEARVKAPCIIFLDEIDAIAPARNSSSAASGVQNRVVNCLLTEMAGIETLKDVLVIAATNRPDIIDDALLRRGRIGKLIYVPLPDYETRKEVFKLCMKKRKVSEDVNFNELIEKTEGYTGAEIVQLCNEAAMQLLIQNPDSQSPVFRKEHFERALLSVPPLTHKDTIYFYEQFGLKIS